MLHNALQPWHIIVLVVVVLLLFGAKRLPDLAKSVGQSLRIIKTEIKDVADDDVGGATNAAVEPKAAGTAKPTDGATV
jgi:sec-independent protein translocase protein TatA